MKMIVKLKTAFVAKGGGKCYAGETIGVSRKVGKHLIASGAATEIERRVEEVPRLTTAITNVRSLRGDAKKDWLRKQIAAKGGVPASDSIVGLTAQLRAL